MSIVFISLVFLHCMLCLGSDWKMMAESGNVFSPSNPQSEGGDPAGASNGAPFSSPVTTEPTNEKTKIDVAAKIESLKKWTVSTYKTTKHSISEQLGKVNRTVDKDLDERIEGLRDLQRRYREMLATARLLTFHFLQTNNLQRTLAESFYQMANKEEGLSNDFAVHSEALRGVAQNGEILLKSLQNFVSSLETLADKTIQDTILTIDTHDQARLEYDVYRCELQNVRNANASNPSIPELEIKCNALQTKYDSLKEDIRVKLALLEENRCKVMRRQISIMQNALSAYYSGNESSMKVAIEQLRTGSMTSSLADNDPMQPPYDCQQLTSGDSVGQRSQKSFLEK